ARGYRELVLTGVDITSYEAKLGRLCHDLLAAIPDLPRLRLTSLDPAEIDDDLWALIADEKRLMPHLHLSLQAGDDLILKRMKRRHSSAQALAVAERARELRPGIALGADLIAGFPTESDAAFANTLATVAAMGLDYLHVFPFSPRPGTPAARMPQLPGGVIHERAARLREVGAGALARSLAGRIGSVADVLIERNGVGHTEHYAPVRFAPVHEIGAVVPMRLGASDGRRIDAVPA
ncbi:MAG: radical SAM protein, partial [Stellaceae bacterium]